MSRLRLCTGLLWVFLPLALLVVELYFLVANDFHGWFRLLTPAFICLFVSACGVYYLLGWPGAKWVLRVLGVVATVYFLFFALEAADQGPGQPLDWGNALVPLAVVAFGVFSVVVAERA